MKKVFASTLTAALALSLAACGGHGADNAASVDAATANEDFATNDTFGNDLTLDANATGLDANATSFDANAADGNAGSVEGNAL